MTAPASPHASWLHRFAFRFFAVYVFLYLLRFAVQYFLPPLTAAFTTGTNAIAAWTVREIFGRTTPIYLGLTGSGDTTAQWTLAWVYLSTAMIAAVIWSAFDRARRHDDKIHGVIRTYARYLVGASMVTYGLVKIIKTQFPAMTPERLMQTFAETSPMGLVWAFMGHSTGYNLFTGLIEFLGGVLLFSRRTSTLGALITAGAMANVTAINLFYDVPVKLYSLHLFAIAVALAAPDFPRLWRLFVSGEAVPAARRRWKPGSARACGTLLAVQLLAAGWIVGSQVFSAWRTHERYFGAHAARPALEGLWEVEEFTRAGEKLEPLTTESRRWRRFAINFFGIATVQYMNDRRGYYFTETDPAAQKLKFVASQTKKVLADFTYSRDGDRLQLNGTADEQELSVQLKRVDPAKTELLGRGFHWVSEFPYNR